jgi:hypothetical protein
MEDFPGLPRTMPKKNEKIKGLSRTLFNYT